MSANNIFSNERLKNKSNHLIKQNLRNNIDTTFKKEYINKNIHKKHYGNNNNNYNYNYGYYINYDDYTYPYYIYNSQYYYDIKSYLQSLSIAGIFLSENDIIMLEPNHHYISSKPSIYNSITTFIDALF